jgi:hypothetical protein
MPQQKRDNLTTVQSVRLDAALSLIESGRARTVQDAMLQAGAIADFVMTGEVKGLTPGAGTEMPGLSGRPTGVARN